MRKKLNGSRWMPFLVRSSVECVNVVRPKYSLWQIPMSNENPKQIYVAELREILNSNTKTAIHNQENTNYIRHLSKRTLKHFRFVSTNSPSEHIPQGPSFTTSSGILVAQDCALMWHSVAYVLLSLAQTSASSTGQSSTSGQTHWASPVPVISHLAKSLSQFARRHTTVNTTTKKMCYVHRIIPSSDY